MESLKKYLQINGGFSLVSGLAMVLFSRILAGVFGLKSSIAFLVIGFGLLFFGSFVIFVSQKRIENKKMVQLITILDIFWVLGSLAIIVFNLFGLSPTGTTLIAVVMVIIAYFALNQYRFNR